MNIEYEKLVTELESTKEYQAERAAEVQKWKDDNKGPNMYISHLFLNATKYHLWIVLIIPSL